MGLFKKAVKAESKLRMAIAGPAGSGKTYSALALATQLAQGKPVAVIDTENGSASKYADLFAFDVAEMHAPFHPDKFITAIAEAAQAGYAVVIIDSISHAWSGTGGVLDIVDEAAKRSKSGNTYTAWKEGTPIHNRLIDAIVQSRIHIIATMRSKTEYILADNGNGRQAPRKVGMAPVQRDQFEYEFDVVMEMDVNNNGIITKTRCPALNERVFTKPGQEMASLLATWLHGAPAPVAPAPASAKPAPVEPVEPEPGVDNPFDKEPSPARPVADAVALKRLNTVGRGLYGAEWDTMRPQLVEWISKGAVKSSKDLTPNEVDALVAKIERKAAQAAAAIQSAQPEQPVTA